MNKKTLTLILMSLAIADFLGAIDGTAVNIALPTITRDLSIPISISQWVPNAYTLALVSFLIFAGKIGDRIGPKKMYLVGLTVFGLTSLFLGFINDPYLLIAVRGIQGLGTAILYTMPMSIIAHLWKEREKAFAVTATFFAGGMLVGPIIGGVFSSLDFTGYHGWHLLFLLNIPFVIIGALIANKYIPKIETKTDEKTDFVSVILLFSGLSLIILGLTAINKLFIIPGLVLLLILYFYESKTKKPLLDFSLFRDTTFTSANLLSFFSMMALIGMSFILTFYFQDTLGWSPIKAGMALLPVPIVTGIFSAIGGKLKNWKTGALLNGFLILGGIGLLTFTSPDIEYYKLILPALVLISAGGGFLMTTIFAAILGSAPTEKSGNVAGILNTLQQLGSLIGIAIVATMVMEYNKAFFLLVLVAVCGLVSALFVKNKKTSDPSVSGRI